MGPILMMDKQTRPYVGADLSRTSPIHRPSHPLIPNAGNAAAP
jgi:hypothetical protein